MHTKNAIPNVGGGGGGGINCNGIHEDGNNRNNNINNSNNKLNDNGTSSGNNIPVAFVEFNNAAFAGSAMMALQGKYLLSSDRGAIRIEFAKSKMAANDAQQCYYNIWREVCVLWFI